MRFDRNKLLVILLTVATGAAAVENMVLVKRVSTLQAMLNASREVPALRVGDIIQQVSLVDLNGRTVPLSVEKPQILFVFSSNCPFCRKNLANWKAIEQRVGKSNVRYLSVDPADVARQFAREHEIEDRTLVLSRSQVQALKSFRVPETIEVAGGRVVGVRIGVLSSAEASRISLMN